MPHVFASSGYPDTILRGGTWSLKATSGGGPVLTLVQAKQHVKVVHSIEDDLITEYNRAATEIVELRTNRALLATEYRQRGSLFPLGRQPIRLLRGPLNVATTVSLKYLDPEGVEITLDEGVDFIVDTDAEIPKIHPTEALGRWPQVARQRPDAVEVLFGAGEDDSTTVPAMLIQAVRLILGSAYEHREEIASGVPLMRLPDGAETIMKNLRINYVD